MKFIVSLFKKTPTVESRRAKIYRDWDYHRSMARTPNERSEIDAIFARNL